MIFTDCWNLPYLVVLRCDGYLYDDCPCYCNINLNTVEECEKAAEKQKWRKYDGKIYCAGCVEELRQHHLASGRILRAMGVHEEDLRD